jgi:hypothetical protein
MFNTRPRLTSSLNRPPQIQIDIKLLACTYLHTPRRRLATTPANLKLRLNNDWDENFLALCGIDAHYTSARPRVRELRPTRTLSRVCAYL